MVHDARPASLLKAVLKEGHAGRSAQRRPTKLLPQYSQPEATGSHSLFNSSSWMLCPTTSHPADEGVSRLSSYH